MNYFYATLSGAFIFGIFWGADSPFISRLSVFNPFSLLHIPLYAILTVLLVLTLCPGQKTNSPPRYILAGLIAIAVAILDELYQSFLPSRDASITDVLLDVTGVSLVFFLFRGLSPSLRASFSVKLGKVRADYPALGEVDIKLKRRKL
ncbi:MAG: VanZ family protein [Deltaproteobacteria bacterium]|nr:VanZ family protein [Deltaproteobacteria bacterium]